MSLETKIDELTNVIETLITTLKNETDGGTSESDKEGGGPAPTAKKTAAKKKSAPKPEPEKDEGPTLDELRKKLVEYSKATNKNAMTELVKTVTGESMLPDVDPEQYQNLIDAIDNALVELSEAA